MTPYFLILSVIFFGCYSVRGLALEGNCRFAKNYQCEDFSNPKVIDEYLSHVARWEGQFAQPGIGYDGKSGYSFDGHPLNYSTGGLYGEPHLFSAPSKESIHTAILALALDGNKHALEFTGGFEKMLSILELKMKGYMQFNATYPGYGCWTPWVDFDQAAGTFKPLASWSTPYYKVPSLDNGEWFWGLYAISHILNTKYQSQYPQLAKDYKAFVQCQKDNAKTVFYRGNGDVSATTYILDAFKAPTPDNYIHCDGYLNGESVTGYAYDCAKVFGTPRSLRR